MKLKYFLAIFWGIFFVQSIEAQNPDREDVTFYTPEIVEIADQAFDRGWVVYKDSLDIPTKELFEVYGELFGLGEADKMEIFSSDRDTLGFEQLKFQQYHRGTLVEDAIYTLVAEDGQLTRSNGTLIADINTIADIELSEEEALKTALNHVGAEKYAWDDERLEQELKEDTGNVTATYFPKATLMYTLLNDTLAYTAENYRLAYRFTIYSLVPDQYIDVYVDALNNRVLKVRTRRAECNHGTVNTLYSGTHTINAKSAWEPFWNHYRLIDKCNGHNIKTKKSNGGHFKDGDNIWSGAAATAHWAIGVSWDYFRNKFGRNSVDNAGKALRVTPDYGGLNAYWQNGNLVFGHNAGASLATLDIAGHEYTHGVVEYTSNLIYANESGALNESFADIFGSTIQHEIEGMSSNIWEIGEAAFHIRSLANPNNFGDPDSYHEPGFWYFGTGDYGGVHTNSGVQNHWFYLLANGGSNNGVTVSGIGIAKAAKIAYRNLTVYLSSNSRYIDARNGAIFSALDLYGDCSFELEQTIKAWNAVNVNSGIGIGHNYSVNCGLLNLYHNFGIPFKIKAINQIDISCVTSPNTHTDLKAGNSIYLNPGFHSQGYFSGIIFDCEDDIQMFSGDHLDESENQNKVLLIEERTRPDEEQDIHINVYPNPFSTQTTIEYQVHQQAIVKANLFDVQGRMIRTLQSSTIQNVGIHQVLVNRSTLPSGLYYYKLQIDEQVFSDKLVIID